ncbi:hypothetical protein AAY473_037707 [Plecturocebus cupreus]
MCQVKERLKLQPQIPEQHLAPGRCSRVPNAESLAPSADATPPPRYHSRVTCCSWSTNSSWRSFSLPRALIKFALRSSPMTSAEYKLRKTPVSKWEMSWVRSEEGRRRSSCGSGRGASTSGLRRRGRAAKLWGTPSEQAREEDKEDFQVGWLGLLDPAGGEVGAHIVPGHS